MTGIDDPYEPPESPEIRVTPDQGSARQMAAILRAELQLRWSGPEPPDP
jgi:adenylylsulfate kinase-like enzyme